MPSVDLNACETELRERFLRARRAYEQDNPGFLLRVTATHRTVQEQWTTYLQGRVCLEGLPPDRPESWIEDTRPETYVVTWVDGYKKKSNHNYFPSRAIDFCVTVGGKITWREAPYYQVGPYMEAEGLAWGGRWPRPKTDLPHVELKG